MPDKLSARTEITSGLTVNDLMHLVNAGASWKLKLSTLATWLGTGGGLTSLNVGSGSITGGAISGTSLTLTTSGTTGQIFLGTSANQILNFANGNLQGLSGATHDGTNFTARVATPSRIRLASTVNISVDSGLTPGNTFTPTDVVTVSTTGLAVTGTVTNTYSGAGPGAAITNSSDTSGTAFLDFKKANGTTIGSVTRVTTTDAVVYNTTSDGRLKTNIRDFTAADSGRIIDGLQPRWFDWKPSDLTETVDETFDTGEKDKDDQPVMGKRAKQQKVTDSARLSKHAIDNQSHVGFVAQEEAAVDPLLARIGAVTVGDDDPANITKQWQRSDSALVPILVAEIKSLRARVAALEV